MKTIEKLTIKQEIGKQIHVCSIADATHRTPLHVAAEQNHPEAVKRLIEIAKEQFTKIDPPKKQDKSGKTPAINNYELSNLMNNIRVRMRSNCNLLAWSLVGQGWFSFS